MKKRADHVATFFPPEWEQHIENALRAEQSVRDDLARELARREDCAFLGFDPDHVPTRRERLRAWTRDRRRRVGWGVRDRRERVAKRLAPWLLTEWEAADLYDDD